MPCGQSLEHARRRLSRPAGCSGRNPHFGAPDAEGSSGGCWAIHTRREVRPHLVQALNIWLWLRCSSLAWWPPAAPTTCRIGFSLPVSLISPHRSRRSPPGSGAADGVGVWLPDDASTSPPTRVVATAVLATSPGSSPPGLPLKSRDAVVLDSPLAGEWFVLNGGRSALLNGHSPNEGNAVDFQLLGANGRTHTGGWPTPR